MFEEFTDLTEVEARNFLKGSEPQAMRNLIAVNIKKIGGSVLDVGCGNGIDAKRYDPQNYLGIDVASVLLNVAKERNPGYQFKVMDAQKLLFDDKSFDNVICKSVLEHLPSEEMAKTVLKEMVRVCKKQLQIGWNSPPHDKETQIRTKIGHFGKTIYKNSYNLNSILDCLQGKKPTITPITGFHWRIALC